MKLILLGTKQLSAKITGMASEGNMGFNPGGWESRPPEFGVGSIHEILIIISYNVKKYEMRTYFQSGDFAEIDRYVYIK